MRLFNSACPVLLVLGAPFSLSLFFALISPFHLFDLMAVVVLSLSDYLEVR